MDTGLPEEVSESASVTLGVLLVAEWSVSRTEMEARVGIEPTHKGFADLSLTTWVPRLEVCQVRPERAAARKVGLSGCAEMFLERETGVEPATSSLARKHSTTELLPLTCAEYSGSAREGSTARVVQGSMRLGRHPGLIPHHNCR